MCDAYQGINPGQTMLPLVSRGGRGCKFDVSIPIGPCTCQLRVRLFPLLSYHSCGGRYCAVLKAREMLVDPTQPVPLGPAWTALYCSNPQHPRF